MNLRKKSTREEFERALAKCTPEDFDGHTEFYRLTPSSGSNGCVRPRLRLRVQGESAYQPTLTWRFVS